MLYFSKDATSEQNEENIRGKGNGEVILKVITADRLSLGELCNVVAYIMQREMGTHTNASILPHTHTAIGVT